MKKEFLSKLYTSKKKAGAILLCTVLVAVLGAGTVFASDSINSLQIRMENGVKIYSTDGGKTWNQDILNGLTISKKDGKFIITNGVPAEDSEATEMMIRIEDGIRYYSTDGGKTWSQALPNGIIVNEDGSVIEKTDIN
ncbi:sialidase family protein [Lutispora thermophila]|uniref:BNR/Asp-box repeat-containing protein n=1 Tax=Lutispora thermophila DSM 19022 TaxID=1122184 RepID=A0A1M6ILL8_9FIRM|nr:sialidase family protein [Lutispora thermophila]SHJ35289.1 BNR/Asp-box repeat-containing protein [Lutispora thermophila DSM 19022]